MRLPFNIHIFRKIPAQGDSNFPFRYLTIELGKWWEIVITRRLAETIYNPRRLGGPARRGSKLFGESFFIKLVKEAEVLPRWYGFSRYDFDRGCGIYMPIPLNLLVALWYKFRYLVYRTIKVEWPQRLMKHERAIYKLGQQDGYKMGRYNMDTVRRAMDILRGEGYDVTSKNDPGR